MSDQRSFFSELKRRNVYKVAVAVLPGLRADTLLPNLHDDPRWGALLRAVGVADDQLK